MSEIIALVAILSAVTGAILSTISGWWNSEGNYHKGKLASSLIIAVMGSFALVNFSILQDQLNNVGLVGLISSYLLVGFGIDQATSKLDRG